MRRLAIPSGGDLWCRAGDQSDPGANRAAHDWLAATLQRDERGFILTGRDLLRAGGAPKDWPLDRPPLLLETSPPGVFAAGDVRHGSVKRVAAAVGEGATAVQLVHQYLGEASPAIR